VEWSPFANQKPPVRPHTRPHFRSRTWFFAILFLLVCVNAALLLNLIAPKGHYNLARITTPEAAFYVEENIAAAGAQNGADRTDAAAAGQAQTMDDPDADATGAVGRKQVSNYAVTLQWGLVDTKLDGDYRVETYREFEVYKNNKGEVVKTVPTENYNYLRYWNYGQN
jgi:hypothetical protein